MEALEDMIKLLQENASVPLNKAKLVEVVKSCVGTAEIIFSALIIFIL